MHSSTQHAIRAATLWRVRAFGRGQLFWFFAILTWLVVPLGVWVSWFAWAAANAGEQTLGRRMQYNHKYRYPYRHDWLWFGCSLTSRSSDIILTFSVVCLHSGRPLIWRFPYRRFISRTSTTLS